MRLWLLLAFMPGATADGVHADGLLLSHCSIHEAIIAALMMACHKHSVALFKVCQLPGFWNFEQIIAIDRLLESWTGMSQ